jgi:hypothetical protein
MALSLVVIGCGILLDPNDKLAIFFYVEWHSPWCVVDGYEWMFHVSILI